MHRHWPSLARDFIADRNMNFRARASLSQASSWTVNFRPEPVLLPSRAPDLLKAQALSLSQSPGVTGTVCQVGLAAPAALGADLDGSGLSSRLLTSQRSASGTTGKLAQGSAVAQWRVTTSFSSWCQQNHDNNLHWKAPCATLWSRHPWRPWSKSTLCLT